MGNGKEESEKVPKKERSSPPLQNEGAEGGLRETVGTAGGACVTLTMAEAIEWIN